MCPFQEGERYSLMDVEAVGFLACGWSLATSDAHGTAIALRSEEGVTLVDVGGSVTKELVRSFGDDELDHIYLTHEHPDHTCGLPGLIHHLRFAGDRGPLTIHGPAPALARVRGALDALGVTCPFEIVWDELAAERGEDSRASWVPTEHSVPTLAYRFGDVVVCGDTGPSARVPELARGASLLVHEASHTDEELTHGSGHSTPSDAGAAASKAGVGTLALIHVHPSLGRERARELCPFDHVVAPADGDILAPDADHWIRDTVER